MFSRVVLATDFSAHSEKSYAVGHALAKRFGSKLFVLHVVETSHWTTYSEPLAELGLEHEVPVAVRLAEALEAVRQRFAADGIDVVVRHGVGDPRVQIVRFAREVGAQTILIASHGHGGLYERLLGGTADRIVRRSELPVLVASGHMPADAVLGFDRVLFPTDLSAANVRHAEALVEALGPPLAELHLVHVVQPHVVLPVLPGGTPVAMTKEGPEGAERAAARLMEAARARLAGGRADLGHRHPGRRRGAGGDHGVPGGERPGADRDPGQPPVRGRSAVSRPHGRGAAGQGPRGGARAQVGDGAATPGRTVPPGACSHTEFPPGPKRRGGMVSPSRGLLAAGKRWASSTPKSA
jgi:nucleotide-binding universal stress UspA family protein